MPASCATLWQIPALNSRFVAGGGDGTGDRGPRAYPDARDHGLVVHDADEAALDRIIDAAMTTTPIRGEIAGDQLSGQHLVRLSDDHHVWITWSTTSPSTAIPLPGCCAGSPTATPPIWSASRPESPFHEPGRQRCATPRAERADAQFWADYVDTARPPTLSSAAPALARDRALRITDRCRLAHRQPIAAGPSR